MPLALLCCAMSADAQTVLTAERVLELAERQNPDVLVARTRTVQAEGVFDNRAGPVACQSGS